MDIFDSVKIYSDKLTDEEGIIKKINLSLFQYKEYFENSYTNKYISFSIFRGLLNNKNIILDDEAIEYLIYRMKKDCPNIISRNAKQIEKNDNVENKNNTSSGLEKNKDNNNIDNGNKDKDNGEENNINNIKENEEKKINNNINDNSNQNNIIININSEKDNNKKIEKDEEIPVKIVNISQEEDNNKNSEKKIENKNEEKKEKIEQIVSDLNENCSIFDLNYKTFLNLI